LCAASVGEIWFAIRVYAEATSKVTTDPAGSAGLSTPSVDMAAREHDVEWMVTV